MPTFPDPFLWGASSAAHQTEGNNVNSDFWAGEGRMPGMERSGDATDSYHRWREDMDLLSDAGLTAYRFGVEWARIEPVPGGTSRAELAHYRRMIDGAIERGLTPVVTLQHFTAPRWFADAGGWAGDGAIAAFGRYVESVSSILDGVEWVCTINEPNMLAMMAGLGRRAAQGDAREWQSPTIENAPRPQLPEPDAEIGSRLIEAHDVAREVLGRRTGAKTGWTVANRAFVARPGGEAQLERLQDVWEDRYLRAAEGDDFIGVQSYSSIWVGADGIEPTVPDPTDTLVGTPYRPDALGIAIRHVHDLLEGTPILVTENGIATSDDAQRIAYTASALGHVADALADGIDVRGYLHWTLLDNYEWGHWAPTFGLVAVDRETFVRTPKPSLAWLGGVARTNGRGLA